MDLFEHANQDAIHRAMPLAARLRPASLAEYVGQEHLLGPGKPLRRRIEMDVPGNVIFWGPPGTGKTTLAQLIAQSSGAQFVPFSAVNEGVSRIREIVRDAEQRLRTDGRRTILFIDEIHRLNKSQQDVLLPHTESGIISLVGATTENPSFEVNRALLSRSQVFVLRSLSEAHLRTVLERALADVPRGLGEMKLSAESEALDWIARAAGGDTRMALGALEAAAMMAGPGGRIIEEVAREATGLVALRHDKAGDSHYDLASAFQKSIRGSDSQAAIYYLARMLESGDSAMAVRRMLVIAAEDLGLADQGHGMILAQSAAQAYDRVGSPEGDIILAQAVIYLATAPKSNRSYMSLKAAREAVHEYPAAQIPMHIRNAPTELMASLGYKKGYEYPFDFPEHFSKQPYLPEELRGRRFYEPSQHGAEAEVYRRMQEKDPTVR